MHIEIQSVRTTRLPCSRLPDRALVTRSADLPVDDGESLTDRLGLLAHALPLFHGRTALVVTAAAAAAANGSRSARRLVRIVFEFAFACEE